FQFHRNSFPDVWQIRINHAARAKNCSHAVDRLESQAMTQDCTRDQAEWPIPLYAMAICFQTQRRSPQKTLQQAGCTTSPAIASEPRGVEQVQMRRSVVRGL